MVQQTAVKYQTGCSPVDDILDGGLKRGFVLELSGPPGTRKEALAIDMVRAFVEDGQGVLFVGSLVLSSFRICPANLNCTFLHRHAEHDHGHPAI